MSSMKGSRGVLCSFSSLLQPCYKTYFKKKKKNFSRAKSIKAFPLTKEAHRGQGDTKVMKLTHGWMNLSLGCPHSWYPLPWDTAPSPIPHRLFSSVQFSSVIQSCLILCDPMNRSMPGLPVHHQHLEFTQTHVHWVSDAIQPSHPLSSPSPPAPNPSQHQSLFQWVNSSHEVAKVLEFRL